MKLSCPNCGEEMSAVAHVDGNPDFLCWTCGNTAIVRIEKLGVCGGCEGDRVVIEGQPDYLCGACRHGVQSAHA